MEIERLSEETEKRVDLLFENVEREKVKRLLIMQCGRNLPFCEKLNAEELERCRFAVLKVSNGNMERFIRTIELAKKDWRDLLFSAGFANDINVHKNWMPVKKQ